MLFVVNLSDEREAVVISDPTNLMTNGDRS